MGDISTNTSNESMSNMQLGSYESNKNRLTRSKISSSDTSELAILMKSRNSDETPSSYAGKRYTSLGQIKIDWADIEVRTSNAKEAVLGYGSYGTVVKAYWNPKPRSGSIYRLSPKDTRQLEDGVDNNEAILVAVKVLTRSLAGSNEDFNISTLYQQACEEVSLIRQAEDRMIDTSRIVHSFGVAKGPLTPEMCRVFRIQEGEEGIGIVMRYMLYPL